MKQIFINGCQRSGTTLLRTMLSNHSKIEILFETHVFIILNPVIKKGCHQLSELKSIYKKRLPNYNSRWKEKQHADLLDNILGGMGEEDEVKEAADFLVMLLNSFKSISGAPIVGEKTPPHIYFMNEIASKFNEPVFLTLHRDPRAILLSEMKKLEKLEKRTFSFLKVIFRWYSSLVWSSKYVGQNKIDIRFEDLISKPEITVRNICDLIKINYENDLTNVGIVNSSFTEKGNEKFQRDRIEKWKYDLPVDIGIKTELLIGREMKDLNYEQYFLTKYEVKPLKLFSIKIKCKLLKYTLILTASNKWLINKYYAFK